MKRTLIAIMLCMISTQAFAMLCPKNFNTINIGDPIDKILQLCGTPDNKKSYKSTAAGPQEWVFYVRSLQTTPGPVKLTVNINNNKAASIYVMNVGLTRTPACGGRVIQVGDTKEQIIAMCGKPNLISQGDTSPGVQGPPPTTDVTELYYNGSPSVMLIFENGLLKDRKM